ncbi:MAG: hydroxymethylbilane synthase [Actinomycetia bacterium]|nr:hydroxymethylbilane synthase [Actinomycetes bacterium]
MTTVGQADAPAARGDRRVRIGTRRSRLALAQAEQVAAVLEAHGVPTELVPLVTAGDRILDRALDAVGSKGLFTTELEAALQEGRIDLAVHSLKDLPTTLAPGLTVGAVTAREDPRDVVLARDGRPLEALAAAARVGTSSVRRTALVAALWPERTVVPVRGNLETRWRKLERGEVDALVLAAAGVHRLGWRDRVAEYLDPDRFVPAPGQGALAVEVRRDDPRAAAWAALVHDPVAAAATEAERALLDVLGGNCQAPVGIYARRLSPPAGQESWVITMWLGERDGRTRYYRRWAGPDLGAGVETLREELAAQGFGVES